MVVEKVAEATKNDMLSKLCKSRKNNWEEQDDRSLKKRIQRRWAEKEGKH